MMVIKCRLAKKLNHTVKNVNRAAVLADGHRPPARRKAGTKSDTVAANLK